MDAALLAMFKYTCGLEFYPSFGYDSVTSDNSGMDLHFISLELVESENPFRFEYSLWRCDYPFPRLCPRICSYYAIGLC